MEATTDGIPCTNCGSPNVDRYCPACGQRRGEEPIPSLKNWIKEAADELLLVEARLPRTLRALFWPPGLLTHEWWEGRRASYVTPLRLYLLIAIPFFFVLAARGAVDDLEQVNLEALIVVMVEGSYLVFQATESPPAPEPLPMELREDSAAWEEWRQESDSLGAVSDSLRVVDERRIASGVGRMFDLLPIALGVTMIPWLAFLVGFGSRERKRFVAHLVFSLHLHSVAYVLIGIGWVLGASQWIALAGSTGYMAAAFRRITTESTVTVALKCLVVPLGYVVGLLIFYVSLVAGLTVAAPEWIFGA